MEEIKANHRSVAMHVFPSKRLPNLTVNLTVDCECHPEAVAELRELTNGAASSVVAAVAFATYLNVRDRLIGSAQSISKSKSGQVRMTCTGKKLAISWTTMGSLSALRKSVSLACAGLVPLKLFGRTKQLTKGLTRDVFEKAATNLAQHISKGITVVAVGRVALTPDATGREKLKAVVETVAKYAPGSTSGSSKMPDDWSPPEDGPSRIAFNSHLSAVLAYEYVASVLSRPVNVYGKHLAVHVTSGERTKLGDSSRISTYIKSKYGKFQSADLAAYVAYFVNVNGLTDADTLMAIINKPMESLKAALKQL